MQFFCLSCLYLPIFLMSLLNIKCAVFLARCTHTFRYFWCLVQLQDMKVYIWTQDSTDQEFQCRPLGPGFHDVVWRLSWSVTGNILAVSSGDKVLYTFEFDICVYIAYLSLPGSFSSGCMKRRKYWNTVLFGVLVFVLQVSLWKEPVEGEWQMIKAIEQQ